MKLISLNMWQGRLERVLLKHLETYDADFACMQEGVEFKGKSLGIVGSNSKVAGALGLSEIFFSPLLSTRLGNKDLKLGNVIFSKYPFAETNTEFTRGEHNKNFDFDADDYNVRAFQHVALEFDGKLLHLLNHHGHHINEHKLGDDETLRQVKQIAEYIKQLDGAVILCGDFNLAPESESISILEGQLHNLSAKHSLKTTRSKLTPKNEVCDYIFVNDEVKVTDFTMDETIISDHNALLLEFELK